MFGFLKGTTVANQAAKGVNFLKGKMTPQAVPPPQAVAEDPNYGMGNITDEQRKTITNNLRYIKSSITDSIPLLEELIIYLKSVGKYSDQMLLKSCLDLFVQSHKSSSKLTHMENDIREIVAIREAAKKQAVSPVTGGSKKVTRKTRKIRRH